MLKAPQEKLLKLSHKTVVKHDNYLEYIDDFNSSIRFRITVSEKGLTKITKYMKFESGRFSISSVRYILKSSKLPKKIKNNFCNYLETLKSKIKNVYYLNDDTSDLELDNFKGINWFKIEKTYIQERKYKYNFMIDFNPLFVMEYNPSYDRRRL